MNNYFTGDFINNLTRVLIDETKSISTLLTHGLTLVEQTLFSRRFMGS